MALAALPAAVLLGPAAAAAAPPSYGPAIDLATAKKVAAAAEAAAQKVSSQPDVIAIVDPHGALIYFERMDGAQFGSIDVALSKARSAALFRRPTKAFAERLAKGATALLGLVGATPVPGGEPILSNEGHRRDRRQRRHRRGGRQGRPGRRCGRQIADLSNKGLTGRCTFAIIATMLNLRTRSAAPTAARFYCRWSSPAA